MIYRVVWEIDIDAATPREAAEGALRAQRNPGSIATVFTVHAADGVSETVDLEVPVSTCGTCGETYEDPDGDADCPCRGGRRP